MTTKNYYYTADGGSPVCGSGDGVSGDEIFDGCAMWSVTESRGHLFFRYNREKVCFQNHFERMTETQKEEGEGWKNNKYLQNRGNIFFLAQ